MSHRFFSLLLLSALLLPSGTSYSAAQNASPTQSRNTQHDALRSVANNDQFTTAAPNTEISALLAQATSIAVGWYHTCVVANGGVKCWGYNEVGQLGDDTTTDSLSPVDVRGLTSGVVAVIAGGFHTCALTGAGGVQCWGANTDGQLGNDTTIESHAPVEVSELTSGVVTMAAGGYHTYAVTDGGEVKCWGRNTYGQLGDNSTTSRIVPVSVSGLASGVLAVTASYHHTSAVTNDDEIKCWGRNDDGQLGDDTTIRRTIPVQVKGLAGGATVVTAGEVHTCAVAGGRVQCWGNNGRGQLGDGTTTARHLPVDVIDLAGTVTNVTAGEDHTCALMTDGDVKCWGSNYYGQLGDGATTDSHTPVDVSGPTSGIIDVRASFRHTCGLTDEGGIKCWGWNNRGQLGDGTTTDRITPADVSRVVSARAVVAGNNHSCALTVDGGVQCWGYNEMGELGDGATIDRYVPAEVSGLVSGVAAMDAGGDHTCAVANGGVKCWGDNRLGQLGDNSTITRYAPVGVSGLASGVIGVTAGSSHTCAATYGGVKCWGYNGSGQLGDDSTTERQAPVDVIGVAGGIMAVAAGASHTCALTTGGAVRCWGNNNYGQLGDDTTTERHTPVDVKGLADGVVGVASGLFHTCVVMGAAHGHGVKCWGNNEQGQLGDDTEFERHTPVDVNGLTSGVVAVTAGDYHTCALTTDGAVKCWGLNGQGQLGDGTRTYSPRPLDVSGLASGVAAIAAGRGHTCAAMDAAHDGKVKCWGLNVYGQLGINPGWTPVDVAGFGLTSTISGRVIDAGDHGIPNVTVWAGLLRHTATDADGVYTFTGLPKGTYNIRPEKAPHSFSPTSDPVTVPPDNREVVFRAVAGTKITKIQVNQVLGNTMNYVAGKNTAVRVFMSAAVPYDRDHQQLRVFRDASLITPTPLRPQGFDERSDVLNFLCDLDECDGWQAGFYSFEATINDDYLIRPRVEFKERDKLRVLAVPIKIKDGDQKKAPSDKWKTAGTFLEKVYPLAAEGVVWKLGIELDATLLDLTAADGRQQLWDRLNKLQAFLCWVPGGTECYDAIVGIMPETSIYDQGGSITGWTYGPPATIVMDTQDLQAGVAHEIGHIIGSTDDAHSGLGDEYTNMCGAFQCSINPPPPSYYGRDGISDCTTQFRCEASQAIPWRGGHGTGSTVRGVEDGPFDVLAAGVRGGLGDRLSFMGSGAKQDDYWITPAAYDYLFVHRVPATVQAANSAQVEERVAYVSGWVGQYDTAKLNPVYHLLTAPPAPAAGAYAVEVLDSGGQDVASQGFGVSFTALSNPPRNLDEAPFNVIVRLPSTASILRIMHGTTVLTQTTISANPPTVTLIYPSGGETYAESGDLTILWQASDFDGDPLHYTVLYRQGGGANIVLGADLAVSELTVNTAELPGGSAAQVQVLATDGINTSAVESAAFTVGRKPPEAFIIYPADGASFTTGVSFFLQGTAYDLEDGMLPGSAYQWTSDKDGDLGTGASNLVILSPGLHTIILTVTGSDGSTANKAIRLFSGTKVFMPLILKDH